MANLDINPNHVRGHSAVQQSHGIASEPIAAGQVVCDQPGGEFRLADANDRPEAKGIAACSAAVRQPVTVQTGGFLEVGDVLEIGRLYVLSADAGAIAPAEDVVAGWHTTLVGVAASRSLLQLILVPTGVRVPGPESVSEMAEPDEAAAGDPDVDEEP